MANLERGRPVFRAEGNLNLKVMNLSRIRYIKSTSMSLYNSFHETICPGFNRGFKRIIYPGSA